MGKKIKVVKKPTFVVASGYPIYRDPNDKGCLKPSYDALVSELYHYKDAIEGSVLYLYSEEPENSVMLSYFIQHFEDYKIRHLVCTQRNVRDRGKLHEIDSSQKAHPGYLHSVGDFGNDACQHALEKCDLFVAVVPANRIREIVMRLNKRHKRFIILVEKGNKGDLLDRYVEKGWLSWGVNEGDEMRRLSYEYEPVTPVCAYWFTNVGI